MIQASVSTIKNSLSHYLERVKAGQSVQITDHRCRSVTASKYLTISIDLAINVLVISKGLFSSASRIPDATINKCFHITEAELNMLQFLRSERDNSD